MRAGDGMRILLWHGWLLSGTGSNVATARVAEAMRAAGHDVLIVCQERHPDRFGFLDGWGEIDDQGRVGPITASGAAPGAAPRGPARPRGRSSGRPPTSWTGRSRSCPPPAAR